MSEEATTSTTAARTYRGPDFKEGNISIWKENIGTKSTPVFKIVDGPRNSPDIIYATMLQKTHGAELMIEEAMEIYKGNTVIVPCKGATGDYNGHIYSTKRENKPREVNGKVYNNVQIEMGRAFELTRRDVPEGHRDKVYGFQITPDAENVQGNKTPGVNFFKNNKFTPPETAQNQDVRWAELDAGQCYDILHDKPVTMIVPAYAARNWPELEVKVELGNVKEEKREVNGVTKTSRVAELNFTVLKETMVQAAAPEQARERTPAYLTEEPRPESSQAAALSA